MNMKRLAEPGLVIVLHCNHTLMRIDVAARSPRILRSTLSSKRLAGQLGKPTAAMRQDWHKLKSILVHFGKAGLNVHVQDGDGLIGAGHAARHPPAG
jgi:hypothetical protein